MNFGRVLMALATALTAGLCLGACGSEDEPSLSEIRAFRAFPVYYSGISVAGNSLREIYGDPEAHEDKRDTAWVLIYGKCKDPPDEGGCPPPLQIHSYSICARGADLRQNRLFDLRGAKAARLMPGGGASLEIFTGPTTVSIHAENEDVLDAAVRSLRNVRQRQPSSLPPPDPRCSPR